jgi:hypothetical protein
MTGQRPHRPDEPYHAEPCALDRLGAGTAPALAPVLVELNNSAVAMKLPDMELPLFVGMISEVGVAVAKIETQIEADLKRGQTNGCALMGAGWAELEGIIV